MEDRDSIQRRMLEGISDEYDKSKGSFFYDVTKVVAIALEDRVKEREALKSELDIENLSGMDLEKRIYQETGLERKLAGYATTYVTITGTEGAIISSGYAVANETMNYIVQEDSEINDLGHTEVLVKAEKSGSAGNTPAGAINKFPITLPGLTSVTNDTLVSNGYDEESDEELLIRYYARKRTPSLAGNEAHYREWAKEIPEVGDAKVTPIWNGPGTVKVALIDRNGKPASNELALEAYDYIQTQRPPGADVTVVPASSKNIDISVTVIKDADTTLAQVKEDMIERVEAYLREIALKQAFVSFAKIGGVILDTPKVLDYSGLSINGGYSNITISEEEVAVLGAVTVNE